MNPPFPPDPASPSAIMELQGLLPWTVPQGRLDWQPFRDGVEIHRFYGDGLTGPSAVLLRFLKACPIPRHFHEGYEHLLVLSGSQRDEHGEITPGTLRIHAPGTSHEVFAEEGCLLLAIYEKPVRFED